MIEPVEATFEGRRLLAAITRGLVRCAGCGRAVGIGRGRELCNACTLKLCPSRVQLAIWALGFSYDEIAALAHVSRRTLMSAARGVAIGLRSARRIAKALGLLVSDLNLTARARRSVDA